jgi:hypothetical protein
LQIHRPADSLTRFLARFLHNEDQDAKQYSHEQVDIVDVQVVEQVMHA